ncbi:MAG TPA: helix-turn-helix domain-containing protein [Thermoanaerobaculia bacterium]|jgi:transcriptional regulator with XRE-family HTH domain|nr:helix-turn-helix domain-containing protein [Thermoanaerobaculia bacterium]
MGWVLAQLRDQKKMTQATLAKRVGIHISTLSKYENQGRIPEDVFLRICKELEQSPDLVIEATLKLIRRDLRKAAKVEEPGEAASGPGEAKLSLARIVELYDAHAAEQKKLFFATLQYLGSDSELAGDDLADILLPEARRKKDPPAKPKKGGP